MTTVRKNLSLYILFLMVLISPGAVTAAWANMAVEPSETIRQGQILHETVIEPASKSKTFVPEPSAIALLSSGFFSMILAFVRRTYLLAKRGIDILLALIGIILTSPLFIFAYLLIKITSKGPVIFKQERVGKDGKLFTIFKFRTMHVDAEKATGPVWAQENDPRLIPCGRFLRKAHIDELPQFFNVLLGDMSVVGPRPERPVFVNELKKSISDYEKRLQVKPGITGLAQVRHNYDETINDVRKKIKYDLLYIKNICLWTDLRILLRTVRVVCTGEGAR